MSDQTEKHGSPLGAMVVIEFDKGLLNHFTVAEWNTFVADLISRDLIPAVWEDGNRPPPITVSFNFRGLQRALPANRPATKELFRQLPRSTETEYSCVIRVPVHFWGVKNAH